MLRACRRVLHHNGRLAFFTILIPIGLPEDAHQRAILAGPRYVAPDRRDHRDLLQRAGFVDVDETDVTGDFAQTERVMFDTRQHYEGELRKAEGDSEFDKDQEKSHGYLTAIQAGLLRRSLFLARRP